MPTYEVWHTRTDELVGSVELGQPIEETVGARVAVKLNGVISHPQYGQFNAIQMVVCRMANKPTLCNHCNGAKWLAGSPCPACKARGVLPGTKYFALETNLPLQMLKAIENFTPHVILPRLSDIFNLNRGKL